MVTVVRIHHSLTIIIEVMKHLILFLVISLNFITANAQYYYREYRICRPCVERTYHVAPVHMRVRTSPKVIVVEEEENIIYYHKKKEPQITHIYENALSVPNQNNTDELIDVEANENTISYNEMWKQTIWFNEDAYKINKDYNKVTLDNVARFMKEHPNINIRVYGYASKKHGSYAYNKQLAANRCRMTKNYISSEYNIDPSRIIMYVRGTDTPEYYVDKWNQCVIIKCDNKYE